MRPLWSSSVVVTVAALTGALLARGAGAQGGDAARSLVGGATAIGNGAAVAAAAAAPAPSSPSHDEGDPDESHPPPSDNPYDSETPAHLTVVKQPVVARDGMLRLPGGRFVMGSRNARAPANERPGHNISVGPFWIDRTEVTVQAYTACVNTGSCPRPARASATCTYEAGDGELPVSCVHWRDADTYCHFAHKRLPTEAEWEYAARGPYATPFPWGSTPSSCSTAVTLNGEQSGHSCVSRPARVGTHPFGASAFGVMDMSGNVEEWTADWYVDSLGTGPAPRAGAAHTLRGGGWLSSPSMSRTTTRDWGSALEAGPNVGFRCARDPD
jgi:formylglycine-generating enzyme required for sulfatase activity